MLETVDQEGRFEGEGWRVRRDGSRFWASVTLERLQDETGHPIGYAKVTRDITERRQAELALEQARAALAQSQKMESVGQLAGGIAHDFNNLLTGILGGASLLERRIGGTLEPSSRRILHAMREAAEHGAALTHQLLAFSRKQTLHPEITDVNQLIEGMSELLNRTLGEQIVVETNLGDGVWPALVDRSQLASTVLNLAVNARDAMPGGGKLTIETCNAHLDAAYAAANADAQAGDYLAIVVSDTGTGMPPEVLQKAFEPFYTTKPVGRGTGLGLSQAFGFVKQSGGHIRLQSEVGRGTTVRLYLPRQTGNVVTPENTKEMSVDLPRGTETVVVVDDHDSVLTYVSDALRHLGYDVCVAADAGTALERLNERPTANLLLTDVGLPDMNGRELATVARTRFPSLRVVYMTADTGERLAERGLYDSDIALLPKPFAVDSLAIAVRRCLDGDSVVAGA
ncbi:MAG: response regulator [Acetobacteraceae bacterium]|nr:response regulator [Acetobacteraceae bacterium]